MTRKILFGVLTVTLFVAGFSLASFPALAELRTITITLVGGQEVVTTVDVPPGTPPEQIQLPELSAPIEKVEDGGPPTPSDAARPTTAATTPPTSRRPTSEKSPGEFLEEGEPAKPKRSASGRSPATSAGPTVRRRATTRHSTLGLPGPAPVGVPNFVISKFRIPPFLLPIYQAAGTQYGIRWEVLAAINEIETDYGRNLNVSSAGALGWMQFIPSSWRAYGTDANKDGEKDPYNPVDAIFAAARYLKAAGADNDLRRAIFAYNHADWYVDSVMMRARVISGLPADLVGSLTGLTQGHFPVHAQARYADDLAERELRRLGKKVRRDHNAAKIVELERPPPLDQHLRAPRRSGDRDQRRRRQEDRRQQEARPLHHPPGRLRQPLHVRAPRQGLEALPGAEAASTTTAPGTSSAPRDAPAAARTCPAPNAPASAGSQRDERPRGDGAVRAGVRCHARRDRRVADQAELEKERLFADPSRPGNRDDRGADRQLARRGRLRGLQGLLLEGPEAQAVSSQAQDPQEGVEGHRRHRARPHRQDRGGPRLEARPAPQLLRSARPAAARRGSTRSRSSTAGSCSRPPRSTARPARTRSSTRPASARSC